MNDDVVNRLSEAILEQAVEDYRELKRRKLGWISSEEDGNYSVTELERFFRSDWCKTLLHEINSRIDGVTILRHLKSEKLGI